MSLCGSASHAFPVWSSGLQTGRRGFLWKVHSCKTGRALPFYISTVATHHPKLALHGFTLMWILMCRKKSFLLLKAFPHEQMRVFWPVWTRVAWQTWVVSKIFATCIANITLLIRVDPRVCRRLAHLKAFPHVAQLCGFSAVCVDMCRDSLLPFLKVLPPVAQINGFPVWTFKCVCSFDMYWKSFPCFTFKSVFTNVSIACLIVSMLNQTWNWILVFVRVVTEQLQIIVWYLRANYIFYNVFRARRKEENQP